MAIQFTGNASDFLKIGVAAAARGDIDSVREILKAKPAWIKRRGSHGRTMLWEAAHRGRLEMVKYLCRRKADIDACGTHYTPYFVEVSCYCIARHKRHHEVADYLLGKGAVLDLHTMAFLGDLEKVRQWLKRRPGDLDLSHTQHDMAEKNVEGLDFVPVEKQWATPLCYALRGASFETVEYLVGQGSRIRGIEDQLFIAADGDLERVSLLLENGADPAKADWVHPDEGELYQLLQSYGVSRPKDGASEDLVYLCRGDRGGNLAEVQRLLGLGADVNFQDGKGKTALHRAAKSGFVDVVKLLLKNGAKTDIGDHNQETCLFDAVNSTIKAKQNKAAAIRLLLDAGADPDHENRRGRDVWTVLARSRMADKQSIQRLLKRQTAKKK